MPSLSVLSGLLGLLVYFAIFAGNAAAAPPPSQLSALSKFYMEMKGNTWTIGAGQVKWSFTSPGGVPDSSADVCKWVGVKCSATGDDVVGLLLNKMNLQGQLKAETLKLFPGLEAVQLNGNGLTGPVPDLSVGMPALKYLDLSSNKLIGPLPGKFPTTLIDLRLSSNPGVGGVFPASVSLAKSLVTVDLGNMGLTGPMPTDFFTKLPKLSTFSVANNKLEGNPLDTMGACSELTFVKLSGNLFKGSFPTTNSKLPMRMVNMDTFQIDQNSFTGSLPDELGSWSKLRVLSLNDNKFSGDVSKALANKKSLEQLFLQNNRPQDPECEEILLKVTSKFLQDRASKTSAKPEATACASGFTGGLPPKIFTLMPKLKALDVSINSFLEVLPTELQMMANLPSISFGGNRFHGPMPSFTLSSSAPKNDILQSIDFSNNYLEGKNIDFSRLTSLRTLFLDGNFISGSFPAFSPTAKKTLRTLHLSNRKGSSNLSPDASKDDLQLCLEGKYPVSMNAYEMLEQLEMYNHCLEGTLPAGINNLVNLVTLRLDSNKFTGQIPALDNLEGLLSLGLRFNDFSGSLPAEFSTLTKLKDLYINNNPKLGGTLPDLSGLVNLQAFDTSNCMFSGTLPANLFSRMTKLTNVNLALSKVPGVKTTGFEGIIPLETLLKFNKGLATVDFSNNMFTGVEPVKSSPSELTSLILASNQLADDVKSIVGSVSFSKLAQFDISGNSITGDVPASFVKTSKMLTQVDISTNKMTSVPLELFSISTLTLLRVDGNPKLQNGAIITNIGANLKELRVGGTSLAIKISSTFNNLQVLYADKLKSVNIASDLWKSTSLKFLMLDGSTLLPKPPSLVDLPDGGMSNLVELHMANTGLTWDFATANNWYCSSSSNLKILDLSGNSLQGTFPSWMLSEEDCPKQLYVIDLSKNTKFKSGSAMDPKATLKAALASLDISSTNRNGDLSQFVPASSSVLQSFKIAVNAFSGQVPDNWKSLGKEGGGLESLDLSSLPNVKGSFGLCDLTDRAESKVNKKATDLEIFVTNDPSICYDPCWIDAKTKKLAEGFHADSSIKQCTNLPTRQPAKQPPTPNDCPQVQSPSFSMTVAMVSLGIFSCSCLLPPHLPPHKLNVFLDTLSIDTYWGEHCHVECGQDCAAHGSCQRLIG